MNKSIDIAPLAGREGSWAKPDVIAATMVTHCAFEFFSIYREQSFVGCYCLVPTQASFSRHDPRLLAAFSDSLNGEE